MKTYDLYVMSFNGDTIKNSSHETLEQAWETASNFGSKWYFYPWAFVVKGNTVRDFGGIFINKTTQRSFLAEMFVGKRIETVKKVFANASGNKFTKDMNPEEFEDFIIFEK